MLFHFTSAKSQTHDTLSVYKKIKKVTSKHKFTRLLYDAIFVDPAPQQYDNKPLSDQQKKEDPNLKYKGKYIRELNIVVYDPFGYSVSDTNRRAINSFQKIANHYHITSRQRTIRNLLLIKKNQQFDLHNLNESERLLRATNYINDAQIYISPSSDSNDSIDVKIVVLDKWSLDGNINSGFTAGTANLSERNFLGLGQNLMESVGYNSVTGNFQNGGTYTINNIGKSYISFNLIYTTNQYAPPNITDITSAGFVLNREFYSTLTKWAGGIAETKNWGDYHSIIENVDKYYHVENISSDLWVGRSFHPKKFGIPINRKGTNIIVAFRYEDIQYHIRPLVKNDTNQSYKNSYLWLGSVAFSLRKYYKDRFIYRFGANEDIAEGALVQLLYGLKYLEFTGIRYYSGFQLSYGKHFDKFGYISAYSNYGTYYYPNVRNDATLNTGFYYFSDLYQNKKWYFRQFIYFKYVDGINKLSTENITLNSSEMYGFNPGTMVGTKKMILNLESVTYMPYNVIGFRFAPLILIAMGMIQTPQTQLLTSTIYQAYAIGFLIRNENLLNSSLQISYGFYPNLPLDNKSYSKYSPSLGLSIKVPIFAVSKPSVVDYN